MRQRDHCLYLAADVTPAISIDSNLNIDLQTRIQTSRCPSALPSSSAQNLDHFSQQIRPACLFDSGLQGLEGERLVAEVCPRWTSCEKRRVSFQSSRPPLHKSPAGRLDLQERVRRVHSYAFGPWPHCQYSKSLRMHNFCAERFEQIQERRTAKTQLLSGLLASWGERLLSTDFVSDSGPLQRRGHQRSYNERFRHIIWTVLA
mmetsp:Transcript_461/g.787  ORF Transcript_461/g.787 Transcript_461/m.787 type:complete len:203 (+) Transcript_461:774-1382(+)